MKIRLYIWKLALDPSIPKIVIYGVSLHIYMILINATLTALKEVNIDHCTTHQKLKAIKTRKNEGAHAFCIDKSFQNDSSLPPTLMGAKSVSNVKSFVLFM